MLAMLVRRRTIETSLPIFPLLAGLLLLILLLPLTAMAQDFAQLGLDIDGEAAGDESGTSVAVSADGTVVAIGAIRNADTGFDAGQVRVYAWDGSSWSQRGADIDGEAAGDLSGTSVALSSDGSVLAIGEPLGTANLAGQVRVYTWDGSSWNQRGADIDGEAGGAFSGDRSGQSVSLSSDGNVLAIGADKNDGSAISAGHVRVYVWDGSSWNQRGSDIDGEAQSDGSGYSVALSSDGSVVAIGAPTNDGAGVSNSGHVRVYAWDGSSWNQRGADMDGEGAFDLSGYSLALSSDGSVLAIGARENTGNGSRAGHVRVYAWDGSNWSQRGPDIDSESAFDTSGTSVALSSSGDVLAIGANGNEGAWTGSGHVRIYFWDGSSWSQRGTDIDGDVSGRGGSGWSVALSSDGSVVVIGAHLDDGAGVDAGHVRVIQALNHAPVFSGLNATPAYTEDGASIQLDVDATTSDTQLGARNGGNGNYAGATLSLARNGGTNGNDVFSVGSGGNLTVVGGPNGGGTVMAGGNVIANIADAGDDDEIQLTFTSAGTIPTTALVNETLQALLYSNSSGDPASSVEVLFTLSDGNTGNVQGAGDNPGTVSGTITVSITAVNDAPTYTGIDGESNNFVAGAGFGNVSLLDDATQSNVDSADYDGGFLNLVQTSGTANGSWGVDGTTATAGGDASIVGAETVAVGATSIGTVHASNDGQGGNDFEIAFNASATSAEIQTLLRSLTYSAPSSAGARGFTVTTNDNDGTANGGAEEASASFTLNINPTNPPVISNLGGDSSSVTAAGILALDKSGNAVVTDPDSADFNGGNLTVTRTTGLNGNFSLTGTTGTGVSSGTAVGLADGVIAAGDSVFVDGLEIGTVTTDGQGTNDLLIAFNASATAANSSTLIQALLYALPAVSNHTFDVTISDGAATSSISAVSIAFVALPPPPPLIPVTPVTPIIDGKVPAFTRLKNVIIGESAVLDPTVKLGAGVTFRGSNIPPGINLTGIFESAPFALQENILCVDLDTTIFEDSSKSLLDSMKELETFSQDGIKLAQDSLSCELKLTSDGFRMKSLPFNVFQAKNTEESGVNVKGGVTQIINGNRQNIALYPLVYDAPFLASELAKLDFEFAMNEQAIYVLSETAAGNSGARFVIRPDPLAIISNDLEPGLYTYKMESPAGVDGVYLVVADDDGTILRQELNRVPVDWAALASALEGISGIENIQLTQEGIIEFSIDGASFRAMMDFKVGNSGPSANDDILFEQLGDMNGDGVVDYLVHFPNGDEQVLYILP